MRRVRFHYPFIAACIAVMLWSASVPASAQIETGSINGTIKDESGGVLPGVSVTVRNLATSQVRTATTNESGRYQVTGLQPGQYSVTSELQGFGTVVRSAVTVNVGSAVDVDIAMKVASVTETVTVTGDAPLVESTRTDLSDVVSQQALDNLPSRQKVYLDFALLMPASAPSVSAIQGTGAVIGGARSYQGALLLDGFYNEDAVFDLPKQRPSQDTVQEFQVVEFGGAAEYGRAIGGIINAVTKSGGNQFSGSGYGFFRDNALNAEPPGSALAGLPKGTYDRQQWGGTFGGPLVADKTFFFASFERVNENYPYANGISPQTAGLIGLTSADYGNIPRYFQSYYTSARVDTNLTNNQRLTTSFSYTWYHDQEMCCLITLATPSYAQFLNPIDFNGLVNWSRWSDNGKRLDNIKLSFFPRDYNSGGLSIGGPPLTGAGQINAGHENNSSAPSVTIAGVAEFGSAYVDNHINTFPAEAIYTSSMFMDKHTVKFGADYYYARYTYDQYNPLHGVYTFSSLSNYSAGRYSQYSQSFGAIANDRTDQEMSLFIQDQWRQGPRLTVNYGVRYDVQVNPCQQASGICWGNDYKDIGPRGAFAYDLTGSGKTFLKVNSGLFYDRIWGNATDNLYALEGHQTRTSYTWTPTSPGAPIYPQVFATAPPNLPGTLNNVIIMPSQVREPMSEQTVATIDHSFTNALAVIVSGIYTKSWREPYNVDTNLAWNGSLFIRPNTNFRQITQTVYDAPAEFEGGIVELKGRSQKYGYDGSVTVSRSLQTGTSFANDPRAGITADYGPVPDVPTVRGVASGWYNFSPSIQVAVNFQAQSGIAVNPVDGGVDLLGTGVTGTRTPGLGPFSFRAPGTHSIDARFNWVLPLEVGSKRKLTLSVESYNITNSYNVETVNNNYGGIAGRPSAVWLVPTAYFPPREVQLGVHLLF